MQTRISQRKKVIEILVFIAIIIGAAGAYLSLRHPEKELPSGPGGNVEIFFKDPLNTDSAGNYTVYLNENVTVNIVLRNATGRITGGHLIVWNGSSEVEIPLETGNKIVGGSLTLWTKGPSLDAVDVLAGDLGKPVFTIQNPNRTLPPNWKTAGFVKPTSESICVVNISTSISPSVSNSTVVFAKVVFRGMIDGVAKLWLDKVMLTTENGKIMPFCEKWNGLFKTVIVKFVRSTVYLEPTIREIQLQNSTGAWITIWNGSKTMRLTPNEPAQFFEKVYVLNGTYVASRLKYSRFIQAFDATGDGDADDTWYHPHFRTWFNETMGTNMEAQWINNAVKRIEAHIESRYPVDVFSDKDYFNDFKQGYFRAVWPKPWVFGGSASGNLTYALTYDRPVDAYMGEMSGEPWYVEVIAKPETGKS